MSKYKCTKCGTQYKENGKSEGCCTNDIIFLKCPKCGDRNSAENGVLDFGTIEACKRNAKNTINSLRIGMKGNGYSSNDIQEYLNEHYNYSYYKEFI